VRNLLHQDSGLRVYAGRQGLSDNDQSPTSLERGIRQLAGLQLSQPVGKAFEYSNLNYSILGMIVQVASQKPYEEYVQSEIFAPLDMMHSAAAITDPAVKDITSGYRYWLFWPFAFDAPYPRQMTPAGFLISSAEDMSHYLIAQLNGGTYGKQQALSPEGIDMLHTAGPMNTYAMGWEVRGQLVIDLGLASAAWILIPRQFLTPMETIRLFTPDIFLLIVLMTILAAGWALTRTYLTFRPQKR
jgi:CubicO group peptidase (beta-lactamase class C family)